MSSVAPSDSASQKGGRKNRPGKNARAKAREGFPPLAPAVTGPSSVDSASFFASQLPADPVPQPGKFPVVFQAGAGEPTRDVPIAYDPNTINNITSDLLGRYSSNPRFAEFQDHSGYTDSEFERDLVRMFLLSVAQQTVHSHVNMRLPLGDFSSISSTDVFLFPSLRSVVNQFGEFSAPELGSRFLLKDYPSTVASLVRAADHLLESDDAHDAKVRRMWIPTKLSDKRSAFVVAKALSGYINSVFEVELDPDILSGYIFHEHWDVFDALKPLFGGDAEAQDRFDFLFTGYVSEQAFVDKFNNVGGQDVLDRLDLQWENPDKTHLDFSFVPKVVFPTLVDDWARKRGAIMKFFSVTVSVANRAVAKGSMAQISKVTNRNGVVLVSTHVALTPQESSLLACFPSSARYGFVGPLNVIQTTTIPISIRATEFLQLDWLG